MLSILVANLITPTSKVVPYTILRTVSCLSWTISSYWVCCVTFSRVEEREMCVHFCSPMSQLPVAILHPFFDWDHRDEFLVHLLQMVKRTEHREFSLARRLTFDTPLDSAPCVVVGIYSRLAFRGLRCFNNILYYRSAVF